ncbi:hypothetical protein MHB84_22270 [Paenibacillus sp. FSL F4-0087]|uniref:hypothetical protein n=1 Tax=Paenibacillus sp. FSL F4-0087 TaxID=2921368 RepID=UPI00117C54D1
MLNRSSSACLRRTSPVSTVPLDFIVLGDVGRNLSDSTAVTQRLEIANTTVVTEAHQCVELVLCKLIEYGYVSLVVNVI